MGRMNGSGKNIENIASYGSPTSHTRRRPEGKRGDDVLLLRVFNIWELEGVSKYLAKTKIPCYRNCRD